MDAAVTEIKTKASIAIETYREKRPLNLRANLGANVDARTNIKTYPSNIVIQ
ncbi:MAG: hypothetical protein ACP5I3_01065 [Thermoproteus sp.]